MKHFHKGTQLIISSFQGEVVIWFVTSVEQIAGLSTIQIGDGIRKSMVDK